MKNKTNKILRCRECQDGEHENYDDQIEYVKILDPKTRKILKKNYMCSKHVSMYLEDGYEVI